MKKVPAVPAEKKAIKFQKYYVTDGVNKARVWYHLDNRADRRSCVTLYHRDYTNALGVIFQDGTYKNDTEIQSDYFDKGRVVLFEDHPLYQQARQRAEANLEKRQETINAAKVPHA